MTAYYNEHDPFAAEWLRELIKDNWIAPGIVDERDIQDVLPSDLNGFTQCHFFAGIGVWSLAARLAGWSDDRPLWSGSCPCQPFSAAGKGGGFDDERHLWPAFHWLIENHAPNVIVGEQVASKDGLAWIDLVSDDMEGTGYAFGAVDTCASGFGAPFIGQRLYWMAATDGARTATRLSEPQQRESGNTRKHDNGCNQYAWDQTASRTLATPGKTNGYWRNVDWLYGRNGKFRPVEPSTFPLVNGRTFRNRLAELRGAGNAINIAQAEEFMKAVIATIAN